jgi:hypothetical protein
MKQSFDKALPELNYWSWDNPCCIGDQGDCSNLGTTSSGKVKPTCECSFWYGSVDARAKIEPTRCRQYKPGNFFAIGLLDQDDIIDENDGDESWAHPCLPSSEWSRPWDGKDDDNSMGEEDT